MDNVLDSVCMRQLRLLLMGKENFGQRIYNKFTPDEISKKLLQIVTSEDIKSRK